MSERGGWSALFWNNHDQPRALNRFVDIKNFRNEGATMLAASIHLSRGTPYIYMCEEIGMIDPDYDSMADYVDVESMNAYQMLLDQGQSPEQAFKIIQAKSRDNSRTPMQWDASLNADFSTGTPWLKVGKSYKDINVEKEMDGPIFTFYKKLIRLRKEMPIISEGSYLPALEDSQEVYAFERHLDGQKWTITPFDFEELKRLYHTWGKEMSERGGWSALFWNNHDQPRALNRFVDIKNFRNEGATMLAASIHLSRGTPYIYMGEEIGMIDPDYDSMEDYVDVESINAYQMLLDQGKSPEQAFQIIQAKSRDNSRTPMQWNASENAGFSTGTPWLKVGKSYKDINVENEINGRIFKFYQELIRLRKAMPIISEGSYQPAFEDSKQVYAFERHLDGQKLLVLNHFYGNEAEVTIPAEYQAGRVLLSNYENVELAEKVILKPYQTLAIYVD